MFTKNVVLVMWLLTKFVVVALYNLGSMIGICSTKLESIAPLLFDEESPFIVYFTNKLTWSTSKLVLIYTSIRFIRY